MRNNFLMFPGPSVDELIKFWVGSIQRSVYVSVKIFLFPNNLQPRMTLKVWEVVCANYEAI